MSHLLPLHSTLIAAISQVKARRFSERDAVVAAQYLIQIPSVMEVWVWGKLDTETHLQILLGVPRNTFEQYTKLLKKAPDFTAHNLCAISVLLVVHRIVTSNTLNSQAFWTAIEKMEESTGHQKLGDSMFVMLVPQHWKNNQQLQTELCLSNPELLTQMVTTAQLIKQRSNGR